MYIYTYKKNVYVDNFDTSQGSMTFVLCCRIYTHTNCVCICVFDLLSDTCILWYVCSFFYLLTYVCITMCMYVCILPLYVAKVFSSYFQELVKEMSRASRYCLFVCMDTYILYLVVRRIYLPVRSHCICCLVRNSKYAQNKS